MIWNKEQLAAALGVEIKIDFANKIQFNSKDVNPKDLFIALKGNTDGHQYVSDALAKGAAGVIISHQNLNLDSDKIILVDDTYQALIKLAKYKRDKSKALFIGVTGSAGKTTTKDALGLMLEPFGKVFTSRNNFNNELGTLINLSSMSDQTNYAVIELGMNHSGEMKKLSELVKPDIAIILNVFNAHIEYFDSIDEIFAAKCEIFSSLAAADGIAIINYDNDEDYLKLYDRCLEYKIKNIYSFGQNIKANTHIISHQTYTDDSVITKFKVNEKDVTLAMKSISIYQINNFGSGLQLIDILNLDINKSIKALSNFKLEIGRGQRLTSYYNNKKFDIIADYYNASPQSMIKALENFANIKHNNKVLIIGDMLEIGKHSKQIHESLAPLILKISLNKVILVGSEVKILIKLIESNNEVLYFENVEKLLSKLDNILNGEELILIKAAQRIKLSKVLEYFNP